MTERRSALRVVAGIDLSGKTCVITGASSGLGRESAPRWSPRAPTSS